MTDTAGAAAPSPLAVDVEASLTALCTRHGVRTEPRVLAALAELVAACAGEVRTAAPQDCRWVVIENDGAALEGRDSLAEALAHAQWALLSGDADASVTVRRASLTAEAGDRCR